MNVLSVVKSTKSFGTKTLALLLFSLLSAYHSVGNYRFCLLFVGLEGVGWEDTFV